MSKHHQHGVLTSTVGWRLAKEVPAVDPSKEGDEVSVEVLGYTNEGFYCKVRWDFKNKEWFITEGEDLDGELCFNDGEEVVWWMYFPTPPKKN